MMGLKKVLILGSGGLKIGQAGEFDYSGSQAIKALKEEGIKTVLINPNIATVQTDSGMADKVYFLPLNKEYAEKVIEKERPDGILLSFGGQTALNLGLELNDSGILKNYGVKPLGTSTDTIKVTEDRELFKAELQKINVNTALSIATYSTKEAKKAAKSIGYPVMMRSGFSLGGLGSGRISNEKELIKRCDEAFHKINQVLIEEYLEGWKEIEYEVVRDSDGNTITVCNMENLDPMGVHTGESIVVAPSQTLTNHEYHMLREVAIKTIKHLNIIGECNIQYALNSATGEYRVIEVNARLSRSSALASKATGYPLAYVAAKLILGKKLHELKNSVTGQTSAFFEPALDYVAVKLPRWDLTKLKNSNYRIGSEMKSVGEVMALARSFPEALQKAIRMQNTGCDGFSLTPHKFERDYMDEIKNPTYRRIFAIYHAMKNGKTVEDINRASGVDEWFLYQIQDACACESDLAKASLLKQELLAKAKKLGFSDKAIAKLSGSTEEHVRKLRKRYDILPKIKLIDTLAGEFDAKTNYLYFTYNADYDDVKPLQNSAITIGSGPYSIGSSVEFDWCAVNTVKTLKKNGFSTVIVNSNPETVSTDFDISDRLYFDELTFERVADIAEFEAKAPIIVSVGGQIANNLAPVLDDAGFKILGTSPKDINNAENRQLFSSMLQKMDIDQPEWQEVTTLASAKKFAKKVEYPVLIRPSYVLSGGAMSIVHSDKDMKQYLDKATTLSPEHPVVISDFITHAKEVEIDGVAKNGKIVVYAISEHIENAGVHSGDATVALPAQYLYLETIRRINRVTAKVIDALNITGPFNIQFLAKDNEIKVIECNVRASRSFPFVSKVTKHNFIEVATRAMLGKLDENESYNTLDLDYVAVKSPQFSYNRLKGADPVATVEMASTGEVACFGDDLSEAFYKSWLATDQEISGRNICISLPDEHKFKFIDELHELDQQGYNLFATPGTHKFLKEHGISSKRLSKINEHRPHSLAEYIAKRKLDLVVCVPSISEDSQDAYEIRRLTIDHHIPLMTNAETGRLLLKCLADENLAGAPVKSWEEYS
ncbi:MAG TPA: carbamoyl-phosphate synthase (glutamine-hydrolyzing) large subunit [Candidatus Saccharimonadales bacterium]|nr:carbamoyl-phosphate synthase (glutamine-hydrolyzing) large subunit [Candidatus Saccharimonadales bacterium]